jgi:hypothetical protein
LDLFESRVFSVLVELMMELAESMGFEILHGIVD